MEVRRGGQKHCSGCQLIRETRVLPEGYSQVIFRGVPVKRRKIICGRNRDGLGGCGHVWYSYEVPEEVLPEIQNSIRSKSSRRENRKAKAKK
jgi:hypothetical protein